MKKMKQLLFMLVLFQVSAWILPSIVHAQTPSVDDCLKSESGCTFNDNEEAEEAVEVDQAESRQNETTTESPSLFVSILKLILALAFVLALIYILLKLVNRKNKLFQRHHTLENKGGISLGSQKSLQVVRIGERFYVVGVGENVELLTEITDDKTIEDLQKNESSGEFAPGTIVGSLLGKKDQDKSNTKISEPETDFATAFGKELNQLKANRNTKISQYLNKGERKDE